METMRKFKLEIRLKKAECLNDNNFFDAIFLRSIEKELENITDNDYDSIFKFINNHKNNIENCYNDFLSFLIYFENEFRKDERCKKIEKLSKIL